MSVLLAQLLRIAANCPDVRQAGPLMKKAADRIEKYRRELNTRTFLMGEDGRMLAKVVTERDALRAELAEVKGREAVPVAWTWQGTLDRLANPRIYMPDGVSVFKHKSPGATIPLYTTPPASPDVEGLCRLLAQAQGMVNGATDQWHDEVRDALSTWRQAQEGKP